jgi:branched-chain amino acid transport system substrate-binding protein
LPDSNPIKKQALEYKAAYEKAYNAPVSSFGGYAWDAALMLTRAAPEALKTAQPGTPAFRKALRDGLEGIQNLTTSQSVISMSAKDHYGQDSRARVMAQIVDGKWKYQNN